MLTEQEQIYILKGLIAELPEEDRAGVDRAAKAIKEIFLKAPGHVAFAIALIALDAQVNPKDYGLA